MERVVLLILTLLISGCCHPIPIGAPPIGPGVEWFIIIPFLVAVVAAVVIHIKKTERESASSFQQEIERRLSELERKVSEIEHKGKEEQK